MSKWIDPPGGWRYGFPKKIKDGESYIEMLREAGYPEEDIDLALKYSRQWEQSDDD